MKTIHSLSGGKTSSYMAIHYPADYNIFSLVTIEDTKCKPKDKNIIKYVSYKIGKEFIATAEDDKTLIVLIELEQMLGKDIIWVAGDSFDKVIKNNYLPNSLRRFCTSELKIRPIFNWWYNNINEKVRMGIGYRYDESERKERFTSTFKGIVGKYGSRNKWDNIEWREGYFPLIDNKVIHPTIVKWANESNLNFPADSNCVGCFHKPIQQLRKNWDDNYNKMLWFNEKEKKSKNNWKQEGSYEEFSKIPLQLDFDFGTGSGCNAGFCTD
jgi:hypothetical protein